MRSLPLAKCSVVVLALGALAFASACNKKKADDGATTPATSSTDAKFVAVSLEPSSGDLKTLLAAEAVKAKAKGLKPFAEVRADWCGPCKKLEASLGDSRMADAFAGTYQIRLDADAWDKKLSAAGIRANVIPIFYELDESGRPTGRTLDGGAWGEDTPANMAPPLKKFFHKG